MITLIIAGAGVLAWGFNRVNETVAQVLGPPPTIVTVVSTLGQVKPDLQLVIGRVSVDTRVEMSTPSSLWGIPTGTTHATLMAQGNKVQYLIDLKDLSERDLKWTGANGRTLRVSLPLPEVDREMVFVQTDPEKLKYEAGGSWFRWVWPKDSSAECRSLVLGGVIKEASQDMARRDAARKATKYLEDFFLLVAQRAGGEAVDVEIKWIGE